MKINSTQFDAEVLNTPMPVLVEFYADWCGACKGFKPVLQDFAMSVLGKVKICEINIDENKELANKYSVSSIPALKLFKNGKIVDQRVGALNKQELIQFCSKVKYN